MAIGNLFLSILDGIANDRLTLSRCNDILFSNWNDTNAEAFQNRFVTNVGNNCGSFLRDAENFSEELSAIYKDLEESTNQLDALYQEVMEICRNPDIQGCTLYHAKGTIAKGNGPDEKGIKGFVLTREESAMGLQHDDPQLMSIAESRCTTMREIEEIFIVRPL